MRIALRDSATFNQSVPSFTALNFGLAGPGIRIPKYWDQYFAIYKYAYIESVEFKFEITETNNRPMRVVLAESNTQDVVPTNFLELSETPRAIQKMVILGGNQSVVRMNKKTSAEAVMGHKLEDDSSWWNTQLAGPTAAPQPLVVLGLEPIVAASVSNAVIQVVITYNLKYFTLNHL